MPKSKSIARRYQRRSKKLTEEVAIALKSAHPEYNEPCSSGVGVEAHQISSGEDSSAGGEITEMLSSSDTDNDEFIDNFSDTDHDEFIDNTSDTDAPNIPAELRMWSINHKIPNNALSSLLSILKQVPSLNCLPLDARTFLNTQRIVSTYPCAGGTMAYFGISSNLSRILLTPGTEMKTSDFPILKRSESERPLLSISINVDGLPMSKSSKLAFWPILGLCNQVKGAKPFVIALYQGNSKPNSVNEYLEKFVDEAKQLEQCGIMVQSIQYDFRVSCIIADSPAKCFLKRTVQFNSFRGCGVCCQLGEWEGRTVWPYKKEWELRTDERFANFGYDQHQLGQSLLSEHLKIGLVSQVPLDYMHLVCLGVMKRIIKCWIGPKCPRQTKLPLTALTVISSRLLAMNKYLPNCNEFRRRPRPIEDFRFWKATEFRSFLLYLGPVVLSGVLSHNVYMHFLTFSIAIYIAADPALAKSSQWIAYANDLLHCFVKRTECIYGKQMMVYNLHSCLHLMGDVANFGCLDNFSAFPFENYMQKIKGMVRGPSKQLQQVCKRLSELQENDFGNNSKKQDVIRTKNGQIFQLQSPSVAGNVIISIKEPDNCFLLDSQRIILISKIEKISDHDFIFSCSEMLNKSDFFTRPLPSSRLSIFKISPNVDHSPTTFQVNSREIVKKCMLLPVQFPADCKDFVCIPYASMATANTL